MNILISGASGLIGSALTKHFTGAGHRVIPLTRNQPENPCNWQQDQGTLNLDEDLHLNVVINLAGPGIADQRWSQARKDQILQTRVKGTELLSMALVQRKQQPAVFLSASAIGFYGPRDQAPVNESDDSGSGFLAEVARQWEAATVSAEQAGIRTVNTRFGIVLDADAGALAKMLLPFRLGVGGRIGSGRQIMSWIALHDLVRAMDFLIEQDSLSGPVNLVAPGAVDNLEFTRTLGAVLQRPTWLPMPAFQARLLFGEMADELLLTGVRVEPRRLLESGFRFQEPELRGALDSVLKRR
ncbi:MAG: TIGR01777 family oxidoreductase [Gammaproteobacteria bacterium]|nr:TIGR01777 family protein [Pseudomonadales bacterium]